MDQLIHPTELFYLLSAPYGVYFCLQCSRERQVTPKYMFDPPRQQRLPKNGRLNDHVMPFEIREVIRHFHVELAARLQNPQGLPENLLRILSMLQHVRRIDDIEG